MVDAGRSRSRSGTPRLVLVDPRSRAERQTGKAAAGPISGTLEIDADGGLWGWAFDPADLDRRFIVELFGDGVSLAIVKADMHVEALRREGHGDGCYGFAIAPDPRFSISGYELLLANGDRVIAQCSPAAADRLVPVAFSGGHVVWRGGLRLSGTIRGARTGYGGAPRVQVYDGSKRLDAILRLHAGEAEGEIDRQFDLLLPADLADGDLHRLRVANAAGLELDGSPVAMLVHRNGFQGLAAPLDRRPGAPDEWGRQRLEFLDQLIPASLPFEQYPRWSRDFAEEGALDGAASAAILGVVILGREGSEVTLMSLKRQRGMSSIRAIILDAEGAGCPCFSPAAWHAACAGLADIAPTATLVIRAGTVLKSFACRALARAFAMDAPDAGVALCVADHELVGAEGASVPFFGPAFDYERLISQGYADGFFALAQLPQITGTSIDPISAYDILFAALEAARATKGGIVQIPRILASVPAPVAQAGSIRLAEAVRRHLARSGQAGRVETGQGALFPLVYLRRQRPDGEVAIVIPTRDRLDLLKPCLASIRERTAHPDHRVVIVDNGSREQETLDYFRELSRQGLTVLRDDGVFNYARLNNLALREIASPFACLLNDDVEVLATDWLGEMQSFFSRDDVGAVGAKLVWPNGMLQHGGVVLGMNFAAGHAYDRYLADEPGYADGILAARECGALTAACLLLRREDFWRVGGFDEMAFPVAFNDVDLCLKLREAGKTLIWSPRAQLLHRESASRTDDRESPAKRARFEKELAELRRWGHRLVADDYYNPNLNLDAYAFTGLASPPRDRAFRVRPVRF